MIFNQVNNVPVPAPRSLTRLEYAVIQIAAGIATAHNSVGRLDLEERAGWEEDVARAAVAQAVALFREIDRHMNSSPTPES
jgi:hypothetical protein